MKNAIRPRFSQGRFSLRNYAPLGKGGTSTSTSLCGTRHIQILWPVVVGLSITPSTLFAAEFVLRGFPPSKSMKTPVSAYNTVPQLFGCCTSPSSFDRAWSRNLCCLLGPGIWHGWEGERKGGGGGGCEKKAGDKKEARRQKGECGNTTKKEERRQKGGKKKKWVG